MSIAEESLRYAGLYEAELLLELMLRYWTHPFANDAYFRNQLLETAAGVLELAVSGTSVLSDVAAENMNLVAAIWAAEWSALERPGSDSLQSLEQRRVWLDTVRRAVPSCFCNPEMLGE